MRSFVLRAIAVAAVASLSCREPTQVTLELSTNAACPREPLEPLMLVETGVVAGTPARVGSPDAAANTTTSDCNGGDIGTLVLYPEDGALEAGALVIGRLHEDGDAGSIERCIEFANPDPSRDPALPPVDGSNCILARRRVAFIEHVPLKLPIRLDVACAGVLCAADQTCVADDLGVRCVSAAVSCNERGDCEDPAGTGGGGIGGGGGEGGGDSLTVTQLSAGQVIDQVAGDEVTGDVYALDVEPGLRTVGYVVAGDTIVEHFVDMSFAPGPTSSSMHVRPGDGVSLVAWENDGIVRIFDGSATQSWQPPAPPADIYLDGVDAFTYLEAGTYESGALVSGVFMGASCAPLADGVAATSMTKAAGFVFFAGPQLCDCTSCTTLPGGPFLDIAGPPDAPLAVAVSATHVASILTPALEAKFVTLIDDPSQGELGRVHVTPAGGVWVAATTPGVGGGTVIARGSVNADGGFGAGWSRGRAEGIGGVKSLWATDSPAPAAYVVSNDGRLFRVEGL